MTIETFDKLLHILEPRLQRIELNYRKSITAEERLVVTLRFLATGMSFRSLAFAFRMGKTTVASIVKDTTKAIWDLLKEECLPFPDERMWRSIADNLHLKTNFPNCIGSIDGKHIRIKCPSDSGSDYFNYKHYYSIVLQAVADADCKFVAVDVGCKGRQSDGGVFRSSKLFDLLETNRLNIPPPTELPNSLIKVPFVLVGDEAYPLLTYLMNLSLESHWTILNMFSTIDCQDVDKKNRMCVWNFNRYMANSKESYRDMTRNCCRYCTSCLCIA